MRCTVGRPVRTSLIISVPAGEIREAHPKSCLGGVRHYLTMRRRELFGAHGFVGSLGRCRFTGGVLPFKATRLPSEACNSESSSAPVDRQRHRSCSEERGAASFSGGAERGGFTAFFFGQLPGGGIKELPYLRFQTNAVTCLWRKRSLSVGADLNQSGSGSAVDPWCPHFLSCSARWPEVD